MKVVLKTADLVFFNRLDYIAVGTVTTMHWGEVDYISYRIIPLDSPGAVFHVNVVVRCIMGFAGPVPVESLDALQEG